MIALFAANLYIIQVLATLVAYVYASESVIAIIVNATFSFAAVCVSLLILRVMPKDADAIIIRNLEWQALVVLLGVAIPEFIYLIIDVMLFVQVSVYSVAICAFQIITYMILLNLIAIAQFRKKSGLESA